MGRAARKVSSKPVKGKPPYIEWVKLSRFRTRLLTAGSGEPVVFLHSFAGSLEHWSYCILPLWKKYTLFAFDLPGFGYTPQPSPPPTVPDYVSCIHALCEKKDLQKVHLVGNSLGGLIAARFALAFPERASSLTLVDSAGLSYILSSRAVSRMASLLLLLSRPLALKPPDFVIRQIISFCFATDCRAKKALSEQFLDYLHTRDMRSWFYVLSSVASSLVKEQLLEEASAIAPRTLVVWGRQDRILSWNNAAFAVRTIPDARGVIFRRCGHFPHMERPKDFTRVLLEFLKKQPMKKWQVI